MAFYDDNTPVETVEAGPQFGSANYNFDFLDNYLRKVSSPTKTNPEQDIEDTSGFYDEQQDEPQNTLSQDSQDTEESSDNQSPDGSDGFTQSAMDDYLFSPDSQFDENNLDYVNYTGGGAKVAPTLDKTDLKNQIAKVESDGKYNATNKNSTATGKYQFLWGKTKKQGWGESIKKVTGVKSQQEFLNSPAAQEKYYAFYEKNYIAPSIQQIRKEIPTDLNDVQLGKLIHFRGEGGAKKYLKGELKDKPEAYNIKISDYIKQTGGVATTPEEQYVGLNNLAFDNLFMPLQGINTIRGLDDGNPVEVTDEEGNRKILYGPKHTFKAKGKVYEKRLKN